MADALDALPPDIAELMDNVGVTVDEEPPPGENLLGLYRGIPQTERTSGYIGAHARPDHDLPQARSSAPTAATRRSLRAQIRRTVLHEIAHHFGISDERLVEIDRY